MTNAAETLIGSGTPRSRRVAARAAGIVAEQPHVSLFVRFLEAVPRRYPQAEDIGWQYASHRQWHLDTDAPHVADDADDAASAGS